MNNILNNKKGNYTTYTTKTCEFIRAMRKDEEGSENLISINCAKQRAHNAFEEEYIPQSIADHFVFLIQELEDVYEKGVGTYYSFQDMLNEHFETLLKTHFNSNQEISPLPIKCYQDAFFQAISDYARELSVMDEEGDRYTLTDVVGVDILADKYTRYMAFGGEKFEFDCDVCECLERIGLDPSKDYREYLLSQEYDMDLSSK